jgi:TonB family protein
LRFPFACLANKRRKVVLSPVIANAINRYTRIVRTTLFLSLLVASSPIVRAQGTIAPIPGILSKYPTVLHEHLSPSCEVIRPAILLEYKTYQAVTLGAPDDEIYSPELGNEDFVEISTAAPKKVAKLAKKSGFRVREQSPEAFDISNARTNRNSCPELDVALSTADRQRSERRGKLQRHLYRLDKSEKFNQIELPVPIHEVQPKSPAKPVSSLSGDGKPKVEGAVHVMIAIDPDGRVDDAKIVRSLEPSLDQKALDVVRQWEFLPARMKGLPIAVQMPVEVNFTLY